MNRTALTAVFTFFAASLMLCTPSFAQTQAFGFNSSKISGFPSGSARLTGGGAFNLATGFVKSAGGFRCTSDINQGPLTGCKTTQGVRWDTVSLLTSFPFKCTGAATEPLKTAFTSANTVVL